MPLHAWNATWGPTGVSCNAGGTYFVHIDDISFEAWPVVLRLGSVLFGYMLLCRECDALAVLLSLLLHV